MTRPTSLSRRRFLKFSAGGVAATALASRLVLPTAAANTTAIDQRANHLVWVWQFDKDGPAGDLRKDLAANNLGILLKTHDGTSWMGRWDKSVGAIHGPEDVQRLARFFEAGGVPFHAWVVVKGENPIEEAHMAAAVLASGARTLTIDLEPDEGGHYWQGTNEDAVAFGRELRRLQPSAWISIAPDPRPWRIDEVPMAEFAAFSNEIAPQTYWDMFDTPANHKLLRQRGYNVDHGVTPELVIEMSSRVFAPFGLPVRPIGPAARDASEWRRFVERAYAADMSAVSAWRMGTADKGVLGLLNEMPVRQIRPAKAAAMNQPVAQAQDARLDTERPVAEPSGGKGVESKRSVVEMLKVLNPFDK